MCGNTAGEIGFIENLGPVRGKPTPRWAAPKLIKADGKPIRIMAGPNGSIQGPCERKWGYTTLSVADWNHDGLPDLVVNSIWGRVVWYRNVGTRRRPQLEAARPVRVAWDGPPPKPEWNWWDPAPGELVTQWRTTPVVVDLDRDGLNDLVMLDHEGYLAYYRRVRRNGMLVLMPPKRIFRIDSGCERDARNRVLRRSQGLLRMNARSAGASGRRKLAFVDWDGDGDLDLLVNSTSVDLFRTVQADLDRWQFHDDGTLVPTRLAGHTTSPTVVDWDRDGIPELLIGAEDGYLYYVPRGQAR